MKITGHIIEASTTGDGLKVVVQAKIGKAEWLPIERQTFIISYTEKNKRAFYIGREVAISIKPTKDKP